MKIANVPRLPFLHDSHSNPPSPLPNYKSHSLTQFSILQRRNSNRSSRPLITKSTPSNPRLVSQAALHIQARQEYERFDGLERAGFKPDRWRSIQHCHTLEEAVIISKSEPRRYTSNGLEFNDGSHLKADVIVFATGFEGNMRYLVREIFGDEIAGLMGDYWGLDDEGELKDAFGPLVVS